MRKRTNILHYPLLLMSLFLVLASSCKKDDDNNPAPENPTNGKTTAVFNPAVSYGTMTDHDGNVYKTVTIGTQTWMAENLRTTKYNDGTSIPNITSNIQWESTTTGAYCNYKNTNNNDTIATFGRLYNWYVVATGKLAPKGWHVPTDAEWKVLTDFLGGTTSATDKLKETGTTHWIGSNTAATNETGFTALPGGFCNSSGYFESIGYNGDWWSATERNSTNAWHRGLNYYYSNVYEDDLFKQFGFSVRCVKD